MADESQLFNLTSVLFGNIDERGRLEDDILDEDCKKHLHSLGKLGLQPLLTEVIGDEYIAAADEVVTEDGNDLCTTVKSPSAQDFSDEMELAHEDGGSDTIEVKLQNGLAATEQLEGSMPPPLAPVSKPTPLNVSLEPVEPLSKKLVTPLAAMLPEKYANVDVREFFPDFRMGKVSFNSITIYFQITSLSPT